MQVDEKEKLWCIKEWKWERESMWAKLTNNPEHQKSKLKPNTYNQVSFFVMAGRITEEVIRLQII